MNKAAQVLGRLGGKAGTGKAKARTAEQARKAAKASWSGERKPKRKKPMKTKREWSSEIPPDGWYFQRWKTLPEQLPIKVEIKGRVISSEGCLPGDVWVAQDHGAEWSGPVKPPPEELQ
jgi:hypothetical protein